MSLVLQSSLIISKQKNLQKLVFFSASIW